MRRLLVVAEDRALTRFVSESLLARPIESEVTAGDPWDISRAHTALEAFLLVTRGERTFDVLLLDQSLPDDSLVSLLGRLRRTPVAKSVPIFVMTERGRDPHIRRVAVDQHGVIGFIEKPVTEESLRTSLDSLERRRRILLVESDPELAGRYREALVKSGYLVEIVRRGREGIDRAPRFRPDVVVSSLLLEDMRGADACVELKRSRSHASVPVVLYGQASALASQEISENAYRADDFVQAPFDDGLLVERIAALVGKAITISGLRPDIEVFDSGALGSVSMSQEGAGRTPVPPPAAQTHPLSHATEPFPAAEVPRRSPPRSASPSAVGPTKRSTRRVPCHFTMSVRNGERVYTSQTLDISHGGIFLATEERLEIGELIDMKFQLPEADRLIEAVGRVAWRNTPGAGNTLAMGVGVKFSRIDPSDLQLIVDYVNRVSKVVYSAS